MYYFRYPLAEGGADDFLPVATTRPETILGDQLSLTDRISCSSAQHRTLEADSAAILSSSPYVHAADN